MEKVNKKNLIIIIVCVILIAIALYLAITNVVLTVETLQAKQDQDKGEEVGALIGFVLISALSIVANIVVTLITSITFLVRLKKLNKKEKVVFFIMLGVILLCWIMTLAGMSIVSA